MPSRRPAAWSRSTPDAACPPNSALTPAALSLGIGTINALHADCTLDPATGTTTANAPVAGASLLSGAITITDVDAHCVADATGLYSSSNVGTINGTPIGTGSGSLGTPGVATVFFNEASTTPGGQLQRNAIRIHTLLGQDIILAGCGLA